MDASPLALHELRRVFRGRGRAEVVAVRDVTLAVTAGERMAIVGPSGCGKTTLLRLVAGLDPPTSGTISIGGAIVNRRSPHERNVAIVFQDFPLYPHMTVAANLAFALRGLRLPKREVRRRVLAAAQRLGLAPLLERRPGALSGGEAQRAALGRVLVRGPAVALYDEPLSNLDPALRAEMRALLRDVHAAAPVTALHVTHDQHEAMALGDRVAVMSEGAIRQVGPPLEVYARPADRFVASFFGPAPMSFVTGRLAREGGRLVFTDGAGVRVALAPEVCAAAASADEAATGAGEILLGIRPHDLRGPTSAPMAADGGIVTITVTAVERLGHATDVTGRTASGATIVARVAPDARCALRDRASFSIDAASAHVFAARSGRRIDHEPDRPRAVRG
jgi:ABC-type sugar transport system ATPase subunit